MLKWCLVCIAFFISTILSLSSAQAQQTWRAEKTDDGAVAYDFVPDFRDDAVNGILYGKIAIGLEGADVVKAWYSKPTKRYDHAILGDAIEGGALVVINQNRKRFEIILPASDVFEDNTPRLFDLDGDGTTEIITIQSSISKGASLSIYQITAKGLMQVAQTPYIGLSHRWLNVAGIDHYTGNKSLEIAIVVTPHIGGRLDLYSFSDNRLYKLASEQGFSNHIIGSPEQRLSASFMSDVKGKADLALPSADRKSLMIMSVGASGWVQKAIASLPSPINTAIAVEGKGAKAKFTFGLADDSVYSVFK